MTKLLPVWFPNFTDITWNAGSFDYVIVLIKSGLTILFGWYVTVRTQKVIEVEKSKKIIFFHSKHILVKQVDHIIRIFCSDRNKGEKVMY